MRNISKSFSPSAIAAVIVLVLIAVFDIFFPKPGVANKGEQVPIPKMETETAELRDKLDLVRKDLIARTWTGPEDEVAPKAMAQVSEFAKKNFVSVSAFRPQRTISVEGVRQLNYLLAADGPYPEVVKFINAFESPASKIAVKSVQMTSADGATDQVRASITLVAYQVEDKNGK